MLDHVREVGEAPCRRLDDNDTPVALSKNAGGWVGSASAEEAKVVADARARTAVVQSGTVGAWDVCVRFCALRW